MEPTVADARPDAAYTLVSATAPPAARRRLAELGLRPGGAVRVLRRTTGGGRIVSVAGSRIALDAATAATMRLREREVRA